MAESNQKPEKQSSVLDKVIMGAIIGTAIGSAIGVSMAPKKGSETRILAAETATGFFKLAKRILFGKKTAKPDAHQLKEIPHEDSVIPGKHVE